ncbi:formylmethanofuran dehydrogenase subunit B [Lignipirellula cremea]|uniref:Formyltransferase/hydrolase complex Fhc subunit B n=1 Tax=Lignipirellula cremea TaxID=2528010 RepID=A0A518E131_9BACT|nr:formylmethanofuran dehydrogenase subunit B [Lignipirellula cremea]QDU97800.1 Formyltransferase/hydrolase complex Fhc subunit B [Lignipirellula cremea]
MSEDSRTLTDVACTVCGCVCDDLRVQVQQNRITSIENDCSLARPWFEQLETARPPAARIDGATVSVDQAIDQAVRLLSASRAPLIFGLSRSSTPGQRSAVRLAERLGGTIDTTASVCHGPSIMAIQEVGESTSTLGEVRNRADLVIFWGADPVVSHPRHLERYSVDPPGLFISGRADRKVVVIDRQPTATSARADLFLQIPAGRDFEAIWALRQLVAGHDLQPGHDTGLPHADLVALAEQMKTCRYGAVFFGLGLAQRGIGHANVEALLRLVDELNQHARFIARRMRIPGDVTGADSVLCWSTGYPFAVNFARGYPRYNPGEYSANELLERREVDLCLLVGSENVSDFSPAARRTLTEIPTIALDYPQTEPDFTPGVQFATAIYGVHQAGTAYRMDEAPIPLSKLLDSDYPTDHDLLDRLYAQLFPDDPVSGTI